jgi:type I restriction enzyme S subunit
MTGRRVTHPIIGAVPDGWSVEQLRGLCSYLQRGKAPSYVEESEVRVLNQKALRWGRIEEEYLKFHDPEVKIDTRHFLHADDIAINSTGDITIGRAFLFKETPETLFADSHVTIVRTEPSRLKPEYLVNLLATSEYQDLIYSMVTGSTGQLELNKTNLELLPILYPPVPIQERLVRLWEPLYRSIALCDTMRSQCSTAIRLLLDREVLNPWKDARWRENNSPEGK